MDSLLSSLDVFSRGQEKAPIKQTLDRVKRALALSATAIQAAEKDANDTSQKHISDVTGKIKIARASLTELSYLVSISRSWCKVSEMMQEAKSNIDNAVDTLEHE